MMNSFLNRVAQHLVDRVKRQPETPLQEQTTSPRPSGHPATPLSTKSIKPSAPSW